MKNCLKLMKWICFIGFVVICFVYSANVIYADVSNETYLQKAKESIQSAGTEESSTLSVDEVVETTLDIEEAEEEVYIPQYVFESYESDELYGIINVGGIESAIYIGSSKDDTDESGLSKGAMLYDVSLLCSPVILGHNTSVTAPDMYFSLLPTLTEGDEITITKVNGDELCYVLCESEWVSETWYNENYDERNQKLFNSGSDLTLVTCHRNGERGRLIVRFELAN